MPDSVLPYFPHHKYLFYNALKRGTKIRILTGNYRGITQPSALYLIKHKLGEQVELHFYNEKNRSVYMLHYTILVNSGMQTTKNYTL